ncbi:MAG: hypothetical protein ACYC3F_16690 [Gemmatimonadaceae bacterium]
MSAIVDQTEGIASALPVMTLASTGAQTIIADYNNSIIFMPTNTGAAVVTMPAPFAGAYYKIIATGVGAATGFAFTFTAAVGSGDIVANIPAGSTSAHATARTSITSGAAANLLAGDSLELYSDGTNWFYYARSSGAAAGWVAA